MSPIFYEHKPILDTVTLSIQNPKSDDGKHFWRELSNYKDGLTKEN